jgi:hypothetical protein
MHANDHHQTPLEPEGAHPAPASFRAWSRGPNSPCLDWYRWRRTPRDSVCFTHFPGASRHHRSAGNTAGKSVKRPLGAKHPGKMRSTSRRRETPRENWSGGIINEGEGMWEDGDGAGGAQAILLRHLAVSLIFSLCALQWRLAGGAAPRTTTQ